MSVKGQQSRRRDTVEFKEQAVKRVLSGHAVAGVARELGVGDSLIHHWLARHRQPAGAGAMQAAQEVEIARLKRWLAQREAAVAIFNQAAAYFAKESRGGPRGSSRRKEAFRSRPGAEC